MGKVDSGWLAGYKIGDMLDFVCHFRKACNEEIEPFPSPRVEQVLQPFGTAKFEK